MNAEVQFELNGVTRKYSVTRYGEVFLIRKTGWLKLEGTKDLEDERDLILKGLRESHASISA